MNRPQERILGIGDIIYAADGIVCCPAVGSCIALVIRNEITGRVGMAHVFLPSVPAGKVEAGHRGKYADCAIDQLVEGLRTDGSEASSTLTAFAAGGASMFPVRQVQDRMDIGTMNAQAVRDCLEKYQVPIRFWDVGGASARTVRFDVAAGKMIVAIKAKNVSKGDAARKGWESI